jgi:hypothetical protein
MKPISIRNMNILRMIILVTNLDFGFMAGASSKFKYLDGTDAIL